MIGYRFSSYSPSDLPPFDQLFDLFRQLLTYTSGDVTEALNWLNELDRTYKLTNGNYGMGNFIEDLKEKGYLKENPDQPEQYQITSKTEQSIRSGALERIFGKMKKGKAGAHRSLKTGPGETGGGETKPYLFGDSTERIAYTESMMRAQQRAGMDAFELQEDDLLVYEQEYLTQTSTVLMIDISHSMILYGEDRITPAKNVAMALTELIHKKYPKDTLDILVFGDEARLIQVKDLPYLQVGPFHTNTAAGLELAMDILRKRKNANKQIFMITDGKPSCMKVNGMLYKNSFGLDRKIVNRCLDLAAACHKLKIKITTFMIAKDPYLQEFIEAFTEANRGKAFYTSLSGLGDYLFEDFEMNRKKRVR